MNEVIHLICTKPLELEKKFALFLFAALVYRHYIQNVRVVLEKKIDGSRVCWDWAKVDGKHVLGTIARCFVCDVNLMLGLLSRCRATSSWLVTTNNGID